MKGFFKFLGAVAAIFTAVISALAIFDKIANKNVVEDDYLDCSRNFGEDK